MAELDTSVTGELPVLEEEFEVVEAILATDERWLKAIADRGLEIAKVRVAPLSAGVFGYPDEKGRRILRVLAFYQDSRGLRLGAPDRRPGGLRGPRQRRDRWSTPASCPFPPSTATTPTRSSPDAAHRP